MRLKTWQVGLSGFLFTILLVVGSRFTLPTLQLSQQPLQLAAQPSTLLVAAAASLQPALREITRLYARIHSNQKINYNFAASGTLQQQIEQGAPVHVFIAAAEKQMQALQQKGLLLPGTQRDLLTNRLVLITPRETARSLTRFQQLVKPDVKRISVGEPRSVPAGQYATEVLKNLGILNQVRSKFVFGNTVRSVLTAVETGNVEAGIVYSTDAKSSDKVKVVAIADQKLHSPIRYPIAILKSSRSISQAKQYAGFLQGGAAKAVFQKYGFGIAKSSA
jgi:molybdate transport system substrate-binding protein